MFPPVLIRVSMYLSLSLLTYFTSYALGFYLSLNVAVSNINDNRVLIFTSRALGVILNVSRIDIAIIFHFIFTISLFAFNLSLP